MGVISQTMMIGFAGFGVKIEKVEKTDGLLSVYISVPEHSFYTNINKEELSGELLAKRYKKEMMSFGIKNISVKFAVRTGEYWTHEMGHNAELEMQETILNNDI